MSEDLHERTRREQRPSSKQKETNRFEHVLHFVHERHGHGHHRSPRLAGSDGHDKPRTPRNQHSTNNFVPRSNSDCPWCIQSCGPGSRFATRPTCVYSCEAGKELTTGTQSQGKTTSTYTSKTVSPPTTVRRTDSSFNSREALRNGSPSSTTKSAKSPTAIRPLSDDSPVRRAAALV